MSAPKVSILMPNYNYGRYLAEAIDSALAQDFHDFEIILLDDGSTDDSVQIMKRYAEKDGRIQFHVNPKNLGMVGSANRCLELARGEYIKFMFTDDKFHRPEALSRLVAVLDKHPEVVLVGSARFVLDEQFGVTKVWGRPDPEGVVPGIDEIVRCLEVDENIIGEPTSTMFRRRDAGRGFDPDYWQVMDIEFWLHLLLKGDFYYIPETLHFFRQHREQAGRVDKRYDILRTEKMRLFLDYERHPLISPRLSASFAFRLLYRFDLDPHLYSSLEGRDQPLRKRFGRLRYGFYWLHHAVGAPYRHVVSWLQNCRR